MWEYTECTNISIVRVPGWEEKERSRENTGSNDLKHPKLGKKKVYAPDKLNKPQVR